MPRATADQPAGDGDACAQPPNWAVVGAIALSLAFAQASSAWAGPPTGNREGPARAHSPRDSADGDPDDPSASSGAEQDPFEQPQPRDPDDARFMPAPHNQLGTWSTGRTRPLTRGFDDDHWVMLSVVPTYAAIHVPMIGRGKGPFRGGGIAVEFDVRVARWLFVRVFASHTVHPVFDESLFDDDEGEVLALARGGFLQATNPGASLVYALDIGRFVPRVDVGAGVLFVRSPNAVQAGQWGGECRDGGVCDLGLSCTTDEVCRPTPVPEFHAGVGLDVLVGRRWAFGVAVRYYSLLSAVADLPIYLHGSVRLSARF